MKETLERVTNYLSPGWGCVNLSIKYWSWVVPHFSAPSGDKGLKLCFVLFCTHPVAWHLMADALLSRKVWSSRVAVDAG